MKINIKTLLSRLLQFVICNLSVLLIVFVTTLLGGMFLFDKMLENSFWYNFFSCLGMAIGFIIPFCAFYFFNNSTYKRYYLKHREEGCPENTIIRMHVASFAKHEFLLLLVISLFLSLFPTTFLSKGLIIPFASATLFVEFIPCDLLHNSSFIFRLLGWLVWDVYVAVLYFICLKICYRIWEKKKLRKMDNGD